MGKRCFFCPFFFLTINFNIHKVSAEAAEEYGLGYDLVAGAVDSIPNVQNPQLEQILEADRLARAYVFGKKPNLK